MKKRILTIILGLLLLGGTIAFSADLCGCGCNSPVIDGSTHCGCEWETD